MSAVQHQATLAPSAVQAVARGELGHQRRLRAAETRPRTTVPRIQRLHPLVLEVAQDVVETGSYSRIHYVDDNTALVT